MHDRAKKLRQLREYEKKNFSYLTTHSKTPE